MILPILLLYLKVIISIGCRIVVYEHCNYVGQSYELAGPGEFVHGTDFGNDKISSWELFSEAGEHCAFYLYEDDTVSDKGNAKYYSVKNGASDSLACAKSIRFNDVISRILIREEQNDCLVELYQHGSFSGSWVAFGIGKYWLKQLKSRGISNDDVSSMVVTAYPNIECEVTLYEADMFATSEGKAAIPIPRSDTVQEYQFSLSQLQEYGFKNDALSSMIISLKETIQSVSWSLDAKTVATAVPTGITTRNYDNSLSTSSLEWSQTFETTQSLSWEVSYEHSVGVEVSWSVEFGSPVFGASKSLSASLSYSFTLRTTASGTIENSYSETIIKNVDPGQKGYCEWIMQKANIDVPFTAVISKMDGYGQYTPENVGGVWSGVSYYDSTVTCVDEEIGAAPVGFVVEPVLYQYQYGSALTAFFVLISVMSCYIICLMKSKRKSSSFTKIAAFDSDV